MWLVRKHFIAADSYWQLERQPFGRAASRPQASTASNVVVVIYAENRSFDHLYGFFPGANGLQHLTSADYTQTDRDGSALKELPPIWGGLTPGGVKPRVTQAQTAHLPEQALRGRRSAGLQYVSERRYT